tara:strand:- start:24 stop:473 length:450 start_codon:yes stop_codon:yes gene_type:complete
MDSDKKELIYKILKRAVVEEKDIPDYSLINDKKKIYIQDLWIESFWSEKPPKTFLVRSTEIPPQINGVSFCLKSKSEMQIIADNTSGFTYLTLGVIKIDNNSATIGIDHGFQTKTNSNKVILAGGGYVWQFKKVNGEWMFDKILSHFQS